MCVAHVVERHETLGLVEGPRPVRLAPVEYALFEQLVATLRRSKLQFCPVVKDEIFARKTDRLKGHGACGQIVVRIEKSSCIWGTR